MSDVLAWIVAIERHAANGQQPSSLDFGSPVSELALAWAEWLASEHPETRLLLNISTPADSDAERRVEALRGHVANPSLMHSAEGPALLASVRQLKTAPVARTLLMLWIGHAVIKRNDRYFLHAGSRNADDIESFDIGSLLVHLRSGESPSTQIGILATCAQPFNPELGHQKFGGDGDMVCGQYYFHAATAGAEASLSVHEPTLPSLALEVLKATPWDCAPEVPGPRRELFCDNLQRRMGALASLPFRWELTQGSGDQWSSMKTVQVPVPARSAWAKWAGAAIAAAVPAAALLAGLGPPMPSPAQLLPAAAPPIALFAVWATWQVLEGRASHAVARVGRFGLMAACASAVLYALLFVGLVEQPEGKGAAFVKGVECTPEAASQYGTKCPWLDQEALKSVGYIESDLWTTRSIMAARAVLILGWSGLFIALAVSIAGFLYRPGFEGKRRRAARDE